jgi:outer membrane lipoprotein
MANVNRFKLFLSFLIALLISGCAHVISKDLRSNIDPSLTFSQVFQNPVAYKGKFVVWGGQITQIINQKEGSTLIEVFERSLNWRGKPKGTVSGGRFLILVEKFVDPYIFFRNRRITVAAEILGEKIRPLGEINYRYPLLLGKQIYLWEYYYPTDYYSYYYYSANKFNF